MKSVLIAALFLLAGTGVPALSHSVLLEHAHPHIGAASYFTLETMTILLIGLSLGGFFTYLRRRMEMSK